MNKDQALKFMKENEQVDYIAGYDECSNFDETFIYEVDGEFFGLEKQNGQLVPTSWTEEGQSFAPVPLEREQRIVYEYTIKD